MDPIAQVPDPHDQYIQTEPPINSRKPLSRRTFLFSSLGVVAGGLMVQGWSSLKNTSSTVVAQVKQALPKVIKPLAAPPTDQSSVIAGLEPLITPNKDFFRIDTALQVPKVDVSKWELHIEGMVNSPLTFTYDDLLKEDLIEVDATLACVSNPVGGFEIGTARWTGVLLGPLLKRAGVQSTADQVMGISVDNFTAGFPLAAAFDRDAIIAVGMNGEPLPDEHGYPARLVIPGLYGYVSATKWLSAIKLTRFEAEQGFWIPRGWAALGPTKTGSRIDVPKQGAQVNAGTTTIAGMAWAGLGGISQVEVQVNDAQWQAATLGPEINGSSWRQWWIDANLTIGKQRICVRATDAAGQLQSSEVADVAPDGATGYHYSVVNVV